MNIRAGDIAHVKPDSSSVRRGCKVTVIRVVYRGGNASALVRVKGGAESWLPLTDLTADAPPPPKEMPKAARVSGLPVDAIEDWIRHDRADGWTRRQLIV